MSRQVYIIVLDQNKEKFNFKTLKNGSAYCSNWRSVKSVLRNTYFNYRNELKIYRVKWALPYKGFWIKSLNKFIMECTPE